MMRQIIEEAFVRNLSRLILAGAVAFGLAAPARAADHVGIGFITTLSGPSGVIGKHMKDAADLAMDMLGGKIGGLPATVTYGDDQFRPEIGRQLVEEMVKRDKVTFVTGFIWTNVLLAAYQPAIRAGAIVIGANAGPHELAGPQCAPAFFSASWQNDETPETMGKFMNDQGMNDVYLIAPDYAAGKDMVAGFKRYFKGRVAAELYTKPGQADYQVEISQIRAAHPKALFVFLPGGMGIQFVKQYAQSGLREAIPLYSAFTVDETTLPALGDAAAGNYEAGFWAPDLDTPRNKEFVAAFRKKYGYTPSFYAAQSFDAMFLIDDAVRAVHGDLSDKKGMAARIEKAAFPSVRGHFTYNTNHFPIEDFYLLRITRDADGQFARTIDRRVFTDHKDAYAEECHMKALR
ncbi:MAG TPA: ABC transporter substrate-binding protein [Acetobacteraceae bacterium]|nr:ABC transporter substrate-binding protein [Acetobacteraceae bacterium]